jgi:hypothetical protein
MFHSVDRTIHLFDLAWRLRTPGLEMQFRWHPSSLSPRLKANVARMLRKGILVGSYKSRARPLAQLLAKKAGLRLVCPSKYGTTDIGPQFLNARYDETRTLREVLCQRLKEELIVVSAQQAKGYNHEWQRGHITTAITSLTDALPDQGVAVTLWAFGPALREDLLAAISSVTLQDPEVQAARQRALAWLDGTDPITLDLSDLGDYN